MTSTLNRVTVRQTGLGGLFIARAKAVIETALAEEMSESDRPQRLAALDVPTLGRLSGGAG